MKNKTIEKLALVLASIALMVIILIFGAQFDADTYRFGITFFGCIIGCLLIAIAIDSANEFCKHRAEKLKEERRARAHRRYAIDAEEFNELGNRAIAEERMKSFICEVDMNGTTKLYEVEKH